MAEKRRLTTRLYVLCMVKNDKQPVFAAAKKWLDTRCLWHEWMVYWAR